MNMGSVMNKGNNKRDVIIAGLNASQSHDTIQTDELSDTAQFKTKHPHPLKQLRSNFLSSLSFACLLLIILGVFADTASASHFRFGTVAWEPTTGNTIRFTVQQAWRRTAYSGTSGDGRPAVGDMITTGTFRFGDGGTFSLALRVTSIDPANDVVFGVAEVGGSPFFDHTYASLGNFTALFTTCCRIGTPTHINNPSGDDPTETTVSVGSGNSSPKTLLPPIVFCPIDDVCVFPVTAVDPDGDTLNFRFATSAEAGSPGAFTQPGPPEATNAAVVDPLSGIYSWDTNGATLNGGGDTFYSTQVMVEDGTDKAPVDFLISLVPDLPPPPEFDEMSNGGPMPNCGSTITAGIGALVTFPIQATDPGTNNSADTSTVTLNGFGVPAGVSLTPMLPATGTGSVAGGPSTVTSTFSFTPTAANLGSTIMIFQAVDNDNQQAQLCAITLTVVPDDDNDGISNDIDLDDDNDGIPDTVEQATAQNGGDTDNDGIPDFQDLDSDGDGISDLAESGLTLVQIAALDSDGNGVIDTAVGNNGLADAIETDDTASAQLDQNGDSTPDNPVDTDGDGRPDFQDLDADNDGIHDLVEGSGFDPAVVDTNNDGIIDDNGVDADGNGVPDSIDTNGGLPSDPPDTDGDTVPDFRDLDSDNDGLHDLVEGGTVDPTVVDTDNDGVLDNPTVDADGDGVPDIGDTDNVTYGDPQIGTVTSTDGDTIPDFRDLDSDNDSINDIDEGGDGAADSDGDGIADNPTTDSDGDGVPDSIDNAANSYGDPNPSTPPDADTDGTPDAQETDSDDDGTNDIVDNGLGLIQMAVAMVSLTT